MGLFTNALLLLPKYPLALCKRGANRVTERRKGEPENDECDCNHHGTRKWREKGEGGVMN